MNQFTVDFHSNSTIPELLKQLANEQGVNAESIIKRAVAEYLSDYGVREPSAPSTEITDLFQLFAAHGVLKT